MGVEEFDDTDLPIGSGSGEDEDQDQDQPPGTEPYATLQGDGPQDSVGASGHPDSCMPCTFYCFTRRGCNRGAECRFCHLAHQSKLQQRREAWKRQQREKRKSIRERVAQEAVARRPPAAGGRPSVAAEAPAAAGAGAEPRQLPAEHKRDLSDAPKLELPEGPWTKYFADQMTAPQRMQTLVHLWNSAEQEERVEFLRHLIDIIGNPAISNKIKGGQEVLKDLDASFYDGVTYPEHWVEHFQEALKIDDKKVVFEKLFKCLDHSERGLVLGTLS